MSQPIAQRTLVKSPPELWAEISDVEALARHLGAFGDIRITRMVPETTVAWEGDTARGTVELSASGWGTKVTLTATATTAESPPAPAPVTPLAPPTPLRPPAPVAPLAPAASTGPDLIASTEQKVRDRYIGSPPPNLGAPGSRAGVQLRAEPAVGPAATVAAEPPTARPEAPAPQPENVRSEGPVARAPRGFLARLRWWFGGPEPDDQPTQHGPAPTDVSPAPTEVSPALTEVTSAPADLSPAPAEISPETADVSAAPAAPAPAAGFPDAEIPAETPGKPAAEAIDDDAIVGILTGVLDDLGFANHRPFSRSD